jgi:galactoside O-acetyltransferase
MEKRHEERVVSYYDEDELLQLGFADLGRDVKLSRRASVYGANRIAVGDHSRIDDFCVLSAGEGGIHIGRYVHIAAMCTLIGKGRISISDLSTLSGRASVYSSSDDYSGAAMTNPTVSAELTNVDHRPVWIGRHVIVGCGSVILPGAVLEDGVALGALSLAKGTLQECKIYAGCPAKEISDRHRRFFELERRIGLDESK